LRLAAISYDPPEILNAFSRQHGITFPLLSDAGSATIKAFGILNPATEWALGPDKDDPSVVAAVQKYVSGGRPGATQVGIPFPGTFMLDRQGRVTSRFFEDYYVERNTFSSLMLKAVGGSTPVAATSISTAQLTLTTFASDQELAPGNHFSLIFDVAPRRGMHVYAPGASNYRVISVVMTPQPFVRSVSLQYPLATFYFFKPLKERIPVYDKPFRLVQDLLLEGTAQAQAALQGKASLTLEGRVEYQACDDRLCYNPETIPVSWTVSVRPLIRERPTISRP
jgi:hypothetical protein